MGGLPLGEPGGALRGDHVGVRPECGLGNVRRCEDAERAIHVDARPVENGHA
jgi:hypothetical protein